MSFIESLIPVEIIADEPIAGLSANVEQSSGFEATGLEDTLKGVAHLFRKIVARIRGRRLI